MHDSFYNSSSLNTNIEGMTPWGAGAQWLWGQWGQSLPKGGAVAAGQAQWGCHCCAFSCGWHSLSIPLDIPLFVPFPLYPSGCCGLLPALHLLLPVLLNRAASSSYWFGHCPLGKGLILKCCLDPLRGSTAAFTRAQNSDRAVQFRIPGSQNV